MENTINFAEGGLLVDTIAVAPKIISDICNLHFVDEEFPSIVRSNIKCLGFFGYVKTLNLFNK